MLGGINIRLRKTISNGFELKGGKGIERVGTSGF